MVNGTKVFSNDMGELIFSGLFYMKEKEPDDDAACIVVEKNGHVGVGCWVRDDRGRGCFRMGKDVIDAAHVLAWFPLKNASIDVADRFCWNPNYHLVAEFYTFRAFLNVYEGHIAFEYTSGREDNPLLIHMDINTGVIWENEKDEGYEDLHYLKEVLDDWYDTFRERLQSDYRNKTYSILPDYEED